MQNPRPYHWVLKGSRALTIRSLGSIGYCINPNPELYNLRNPGAKRSSTKDTVQPNPKPQLERKLQAQKTRTTDASQRPRRWMEVHPATLACILAGGGGGRGGGGFRA